MVPPRKLSLWVWPLGTAAYMKSGTEMATWCHPQCCRSAVSPRICWNVLNAQWNSPPFTKKRIFVCDFYRKPKHVEIILQFHQCLWRVPGHSWFYPVREAISKFHHLTAQSSLQKKAKASGEPSKGEHPGKNFLTVQYSLNIICMAVIGGISTSKSSINKSCYECTNDNTGMQPSA